jgi:hypothetical protein
LDELVVLLRSEVIANSEAQRLNEFHDEARESINRFDHSQAVPWVAFVAFAKTTRCLPAHLARKSSRLLLAPRREADRLYWEINETANKFRGHLYFDPIPEETWASALS